MDQGRIRTKNDGRLYTPSSGQHVGELVLAIVTSADLHAGIASLWDSGKLDDEFTNLWAVADRTSFESLNDEEAAPGNPFPYCVFEVSPGVTTARMSGHSTNENHEIRDVPVQFVIFTRERASPDNRTAKRIAADLAAEVMAIFGGHPTLRPTVPTLSNGSVLIMQYQTDYGARTGDSEHSWVVKYLARLDVPMAV